MALVDVIKKETPQETAKRLAKEKAAKAAKPVSVVKISPKEADMVKKEAVKPTMVFKRGADISNQNEIEQSYIDKSPHDENGNIINNDPKMSLKFKSSEPADFKNFNPTTDEDVDMAWKTHGLEFPQKGNIRPDRKVILNLSRKLGEAADASGVASPAELDEKIGDIANKALDSETRKYMFDDNGNLTDLGIALKRNAFKLIGGLKKSNPVVMKPGGLVGVSDPEIIK